jgi:hypothetical protein
MATSSIKRLNGGPLRSNIPGLYCLVFEVEIATTTITSNDPTAGVTFAHESTDGDYSITFDESVKPRYVWAGLPSIEENQSESSVRWTGYTQSTGVGLFTFSDEDDTSGISASTDFTGTLKLVLLCSNSGLAD